MSPKFTVKDFRRDLSPKFKLVPQLDKAIADFDEAWGFVYVPKEHDLFWHPSGHCMPLASTLYDLAIDRLNNGPDEEHERTMRKYGPIGHFWHQWLQHIMVHYGMCSGDAIERVGSKEWDRMLPFHACVGSADVAPWTHKGYNYIVDFKTMGSRNFQKVTLPDGFADKYTCQMNIYMDFFDYERALIVGINKDTPHDFKEFEFRIDHDLVEAIYTKWKFVGESIVAKERPDQDDDVHFNGAIEERLDEHV